MMRVCTVLLAAVLCACVVSAELCERAQNRCVSRMGCSMALNTYFISCGPLLHGETSTCSTRCKQSLISLLTADDQGGQDLMQCECDENNFCHTHRRRLSVCTKDVINIIEVVNDDHTPISCSLAEMVCRADSPCLYALEYYQGHCRRMWRGDRCSDHCNNSLGILYRQTKARKLRSCICDGTEDYPVPCHVIKENTEKLCLNGNSQHGLTPTISLHPVRHGNRNKTRPHPDIPVVPEPHDVDNSNSAVIDVKTANVASGGDSRRIWTLPLLYLTLMIVRTFC